MTVFCLLFYSEDLWEYLAGASSKPVADVMNTWTKQMGFPVLSVTAEQVCITFDWICEHSANARAIHLDFGTRSLDEVF